MMRHIKCGFLAMAVSLGGVTAICAAPLPSGSYLQTCQSCVMHHRQLSCSCMNEAGFSVSTTAYIPHNCESVSNYNGQVSCETHFHHHHHHWHDRHEVIFDQNAGPIWNNGDAQGKCPGVCAGARARWTGQWNTPDFSSTSVCECEMWER